MVRKRRQPLWLAQMRHRNASKANGNCKSLMYPTANAWMTREIFAHAGVGRATGQTEAKDQICLVLGNCATHHTAAVIKNIELCFLPPYCATVLQLLHQEVTMRFKSGYRKRMIDRILLNNSTNRETLIDLYMAIEMPQAAWMAVPANTIAKLLPACLIWPKQRQGQRRSQCCRHEGAAEDQALVSWDALLDAGVVYVLASFRKTCQHILSLIMAETVKHSQWHKVQYFTHTLKPCITDKKATTVSFS